MIETNINSYLFYNFVYLYFIVHLMENYIEINLKYFLMIVQCKSASSRSIDNNNKKQLCSLQYKCKCLHAV